MLSKKGRSAEERGQKKTTNPPVVSRSKALQQEPEAPSGPPKKARQSRDERQFDKDTDQALKESMGTTVCQKSTEPAPSQPGLEEGTVHTIQLIIHTHILLLHCNYATGKDSDYLPLNEEDNDDYSSGYDEASDSDFETSGPPAPKKSKPTKTKSVAAQSNGQPGTARARTEAAGRKTSGEGRAHPPPKTVIENMSRTRHNTQKAATVPTSSPAATTATVLPNSLSSKSTTVIPPKSPLPGCHGTPTLGKRRLPNWTPPGEGEIVGISSQSSH